MALDRRRRRALFALAAVLSAALASVVACGFPEPTYADPNAEGGPIVPGEDGPTVDGRDPDARILGDTGGERIDPSACDPTNCDCDKDGFRNTRKPNCAGGVNDCDDNDPRAQPNQGFITSKPEAPMFGDWNCSGKVEFFYPEGFDCTTQAAGAATCEAVSGFSDNPGCGGLGKLTKCKTMSGLLGSTCVLASTTANTRQACR